MVEILSTIASVVVSNKDTSTLLVGTGYLPIVLNFVQEVFSQKHSDLDRRLVPLFSILNSCTELSAAAEKISVSFIQDCLVYLFHSFRSITALIKCISFLGNLVHRHGSSLFLVDDSIPRKWANAIRTVLRMTDALDVSSLTEPVEDLVFELCQGIELFLRSDPSASVWL